MPTTSPSLKSYLQLHLAVVLYGFTAILGALIQLPGTTIVWYRMLFNFLSLLLFPGVWRKITTIPVAARWHIAGIGVLMALHWATFYEAIKYANVSVTLSCFASTAFFTSLIEPLVTKQRIRTHEMLLGGVVVIGFIFIFGLTADRFLTGMIIAIISALIISYAGVLNKQVVAKYDVYAITWLQFLAGWAFLTVVMPFYLQVFPGTAVLPTALDLFYLAILAFLCTTLAYTLTMQALKEVSAYTTALSINLEPVYGIVMAYFFFQENEELSRGFYLGTGIILTAVFLHPVLNRFTDRRQRRQAAQQQQQMER